MKFIEDHLGYRLLLRKSSVSKDVKQGNICDVHLEIENVGFANVIHDQTVSIILQQGNQCYETQTNIDIKKVSSSKITPIQFGFYLPNNINTGEWNIYFKITDSLNNKCHIQFANPDIYYSTHAANFIGKINITANSSGQNISFKQAYVENAPDGFSYEMQETTSNGWNPSDLVVSDNASGKIYMKSDERYLFLRCEDNLIPETTHVHFRIATNPTITNSNDDKAYDFYIVNKLLYLIDPATGNALNSSISSVEQDFNKTSSYLEYKIKLTTLNISSHKDVTALSIKLLNSGWSTIKSFNSLINK